MLHEDHHIILFLLISIGAFLLVSLIFLSILFVSRNARAKRKELRERLQPQIERILFPVIFLQREMDDVLKDKMLVKILSDKVTKRILLISTIKLHASYSGDSLEKLREFYVRSGLVNVSAGKLKASKWRIQIDGIRELSLFNIEDKFSAVEAFLRSKNEFLRYEALIAMIRMKKGEGLDFIADYQYHLNSWTQLNIIFELKKNNIADLKLDKLLKSKNESVCIFAMRLIAEFYRLEYKDLLQIIAEHSENPYLKKHANVVLGEMQALISWK